MGVAEIDNGEKIFAAFAFFFPLSAARSNFQAAAHVFFPIGAPERSALSHFRLPLRCGRGILNL